MEQENKKEFCLVKKTVEAENITSLYFKPVDGKKYKYISGQYVNIKPMSISGHGKSYTISSTPQEKFLCITIKKKGEVSSSIIHLSIGEKIILEGPYGNFYPEKDVKDIVMIAGGIGITPFFSIIKSKLKSNTKNKILLFYSNKTVDQAPFFKELNELSKKCASFNVIHFLTEEKKKHTSIKEYKRINRILLEKYLVSYKNKCYYVCGSIKFVDDMWKILKSMGVLEEFIFTESFF